MRLEEKVSQMMNVHLLSTSRHSGVRLVNETSALQIRRCGCLSARIGLGATFDTRLMSRVAAAIDERAKYLKYWQRGARRFVV
jgi:hypothetical protein